ncbi:MAG TPA: site-2 protease family protein [Patescibacteria group bacterium]|nr:site-2 protease family protein [Patescibacteria group bacterium]
MDALLNPIFITDLVVLIFSAILHEIAHGYVADRLGDPTARLLGRLTLDPRPHIDPIMTLALPILLVLSGSPVIFGGAKPVPVDPFNLRDGRKDLALVSLCGPLTNIILAIIAGLLLKLLLPTLLQQSFFVAAFTFLLHEILKINLLLAIFNLLPIPPLDGSKVFSLLLPEAEANSYLSLGNFGVLILFFLLAFPLGSFSLSGLISNIFTFTYGLFGLPM